jgi:phage tail-like protein
MSFSVSADLPSLSLALPSLPQISLPGFGPSAAADDPAVTVCFLVKIDNDAYDLGLFNTCDGLGVEVTVEQRQEGGNNGFSYQLPGPLKYTNIKFSRPLNANSSRVAAWMSSMVGGITRTTAVIQAMTLSGTVVCTWNLQGVIPVKWTGPQFSTDGPKVAMETLEVAHHGFLFNG